MGRVKFYNLECPEKLLKQQTKKHPTKRNKQKYLLIY